MIHISSYLLLVNHTRKQHFLLHQVHLRPLYMTAYLECYIFSFFFTFKSPQIISSDCLDIHTFQMPYEDK